ncbi:MAG: hypothetical protein ACLQCB_14730 [Spirochaetia bacterium]
MAVIDSILKEEIARLRSLRAHYAAKNAALPAGTLVIKKRNGRQYAYRAYREGSRVVTLYVGPASSPKVKKLSASLSQRRKIHAEIKAVDASAARLKKMLSVR